MSCALSVLQATNQAASGGKSIRLRIRSYGSPLEEMATSAKAPASHADMVSVGPLYMNVLCMNSQMLLTLANLANTACSDMHCSFEPTPASAWKEDCHMQQPAAPSEHDVVC
jgi:hypothetical protein